MVDHYSINGNDRKMCPFLEELSEIYGYKPNVNLVGTASTLEPEILTANPKREGSAENKYDDGSGNDRVAEVSFCRPSTSSSSGNSR